MIATILGILSEIIKVSPIIREFERRNLDFIILHTGQHYFNTMNRTSAVKPKLSELKYNLNIGSGTQALDPSCYPENLIRFLSRRSPIRKRMQEEER